eukprot:scaffold8748_cov74-Skeletonema_menzelii.AAC.1
MNAVPPSITPRRRKKLIFLLMHVVLFIPREATLGAAAHLILKTPRMVMTASVTAMFASVKTRRR